MTGPKKLEGGFMSTRMTDTDTEMRRDDTYARPAIWPWIVLAIVAAAVLWWAAANHSNRMTNYSATPSNVSTPNSGMTAPGPGGTGGGAGSAR